MLSSMYSQDHKHDDGNGKAKWSPPLELPLIGIMQTHDINTKHFLHVPPFLPPCSLTLKGINERKVSVSIPPNSNTPIEEQKRGEMWTEAERERDRER